MKIDEAIEQLKYDMAMCKFDPTTGKDFVSLDCQKAYEVDKLAIKSLEAWEKVKEEVEDKIRSLDDELKNGEVCLSYYYGKLDGLSEVLEIIDKHLKEVEK